MATASPTPPDIPPPAESPAEAEAPGTVRPPRRWGRTLALLAAALLVGTAGGTAVGYRIQADREPTALPPLAQADLAYPGDRLPADQAALPYSEEEDRQAATTYGDLRELLVEPPEGSQEWIVPAGVDGWKDLQEHSEGFTSPDVVFERGLDDGIRRVAVTTWSENDAQDTEIELVQFHESQDISAPEYLEGQQRTMTDPDLAGPSEGWGRRIDGTLNARYYMWDETIREPGYYPYTVYSARVLAQRGDVVMDISVYGFDQEIDEDALVALAKKQLERL